MRVGWIGVLAAGCALAGEHAAAGRAERAAVVQAIEFKNFHGVAAKDIVERLHDRDIEMVSRAYSARCVETAQAIVEELLAEKGQRGVRVVPTVMRVKANTVRVVFTAAE